MKTVELILEKNDGLLWGRVESEGWMPTPYGETVADVIANLKELVDDYVRHEGKNDKTWNTFNRRPDDYELCFEFQQ